MRRGKGVRNVMVLLIMVITVLALYYHTVNRVREKSDKTTVTLVQETLLKNLDENYPATPREVLKFYNQILQCYYNETYTDEEFAGLTKQALALFDEEFAAQQNGKYPDSVKKEVAGFKDKSIVMSSAAPASGTDVEYYSYEGRDCASIRCVYTMREKTCLASSKQIFVMRKDEKGHWRILGWKDQTN